MLGYGKKEGTRPVRDSAAVTQQSEVKREIQKRWPLVLFAAAGALLIGLGVAWFAVRFDSQTFGIFDAFEEEEGRRAHLNGQVAATLLARAKELFAVAPVIRSVDVLADKLPS